MSIRDQIVSEIMKLVRPAMVPMVPKPSIEQLEKILNSEYQPKMQILPDGNILEEAPPHTMGDIADAVLRIIQPKINRLESALQGLVDALATNDEDGLTEFADVMCAARAALNNGENT